ncbi:ATP-grasp domain-containing protein [Caldivirga maquilingensis]|uniref:Alpha-L-glutamate ligase, RimK family n=1 Tax=Caldivirga maquilingensis (strain ATCC 700844 / DSM 13496 / JCM 10307 / IC-167) TaxID=397948 RepID=A8M8Q5_CALMQ|nr:RimK family alpha-L-glutamate ligase [Caldivirga maquilingensis]ABW02124.1 alpha-L-glutamate ligase, RimK family [Caldivirga maquilingensis IC-167]
MELTITYDYLREEEVELIKAFNELGVNVNTLQSTKPLHVKELNGVFLVRNLNHRTAITMAGIIENTGGVSINRYLTLSLTWNKAITTALLKRIGLPVPDTYVVFEPIIDGVAGGGRIIKPASGSWGRLTAIVSDGEAKLLIKHAKDHLPVLLQERIGDGSDLRIFVINGSVVASMMRKPPQGDWRSNVARGGLAMPIKVNEELEEYAIKATEAVGAFYAGVDVLIGRDGYYISEINGIPEFKAISKVSGVRVSFKLAEAVSEWIKR